MPEDIGFLVIYKIVIKQLEEDEYGIYFMRGN